MEYDFNTKKNHIAIIDFEATCDKYGFSRNKMEIIEIGCIIIDRTLTVVDTFESFIKPVIRPKLTEFCKDLTSITQEQVDGAQTFKEVLRQFNNDVVLKYNPLFASWGGYDKNQLMQDCRYHRMRYPFDEEHLDIKRWLVPYLYLKKPKGIAGVLKYLNMEFEGTAHRGIDDVRNIVRILENCKNRLPVLQK